MVDATVDDDVVGGVGGAVAGVGAEFGGVGLGRGGWVSWGVCIGLGWDGMGWDGLRCEGEGRGK